MFWQQIEQAITEKTAQNFKIIRRESVGGGDISQAYRLSGEHQEYFVKTNRKQLAFMFVAEAAALDGIHLTRTIKVPKPITSGIFDQHCYLIMEWINFSGQPSAQTFAQQLALMHHCTHDQFGFAMDNTIGSTPQVNHWSEHWVDFWTKQRLGYQLGQIKKNGLSHRLFDMGLLLQEKSALFFETYQPKASLLHGDLWSGNWAADEHGQPVIFDPASYYGDHEADLAMMELFGHPGRQFFDAYRESFEVDKGYSVRKNFYNLYHILNHANMFGGSYAMQAQNMMEVLLAEVR